MPKTLKCSMPIDSNLADDLLKGGPGRYRKGGADFSYLNPAPVTWLTVSFSILKMP